MTAGTVERQAEERLADDTDHVLHLLLARDGTLRGVGLGIACPVPRAADEHARGDDPVARHRLEDVAGELLLHEAVVGLVFVEALDDVIAVVPGAVTGMVVFESLALGVADDVEPVSAPALAVMGRGEQVIDEPVVGGLRGIGHESLDLFRARREADEIDKQATDEDPGIGGGGRSEAGVPESVEHPGIDGAPHPPVGRRRRQRRLRERLQRPPVPAGPRRGREGERIERLFAPSGAPLDPGAEKSFFSVIEGMLRRHLVGLHPGKEETSDVPRLEGRPTLPTPARAVGIDQRQPAVGTGAGMAFEAAGDEERRDLPVEVDRRLSGFGGSGRLEPRHATERHTDQGREDWAKVHDAASRGLRRTVPTGRRRISCSYLGPDMTTDGDSKSASSAVLPARSCPVS